MEGDALASEALICSQVPRVGGAKRQFFELSG